MKRISVAIVALVLMVPSFVAGQVLGGFTTAAISEEVEGGAFFSAGKDVYRVGVMSRFLLHKRSDLGFQLGADHKCENTTYGIGADIKYYIISAESQVPVDLAVDGTYGYFLSGDYSRHIFGLGLLVSGILTQSESYRLEPYAALYVLSTQFGKTPECERESQACWPCEFDDWDSITDTIVRLGIKIPIEKQYQILAEVEIGDDTYIGGAFNYVF
jgi:hypothetical protein